MTIDQCTVNLFEQDGHLTFQQMRDAGLIKADAPVKLHLGCGETILKGYVNLDYPPSEHNVMRIDADVYADIVTLNLPASSVDEIRLHHVFEHFSRVTALAMLIKWQRWLKPGGTLHINTPDITGCAQNIVTTDDFKVKMGNIRHLAGDQAASWAYHVDHWFPERFVKTLSALGFDQIKTTSDRWKASPFLADVTAIATKRQEMSLNELIAKAKELLWDSTVSPEEKPTYEVWCKQLEELFSGGQPPAPSNTTPLNFQEAVNAIKAPENVELNEVTDFNQLGRDAWVKAKAESIARGSKILDVGAGTCPYKALFAHCDYKTHDFKQYEGEKLGGTTEYGQIDYVSDIVSIPVPDASFDAILCTEVLEHVPEPIRALQEMARILKPGGRLFMSAPLGSGLHQIPYHFYGGYTPYWYRHFCAQFGLEVVEIKGNKGFLAHLAQSCSRAARMVVSDPAFTPEVKVNMLGFFGSTLPRFFFSLDERHYLEDFTVGYFVEARKPK